MTEQRLLRSLAGLKPSRYIFDQGGVTPVMRA